MQTTREMTCSSKNQREDIFDLPHPLPPGQNQFPTFGPEGLNLSQGLRGVESWMVTSQIEPWIS